MKVKTFLALSMIASLAYGLFYFLLPQATADFYGFGSITTPLSNSMLQFMGVLFIAEGVMCGVARNAERSLGRTAVLTFVMVASLLCFYLDVKILLDEPGMMDYFDSVVNALLGFGALYYILQDRKSVEV